MNISDNVPDRRAQAAVLSMLLNVLAAVIAGACLILAGLVVSGPDSGPYEVVTGVLVALGGLGMAALLWAAGWIIQQLTAHLEADDAPVLRALAGDEQVAPGGDVRPVAVAADRPSAGADSAERRVAELMAAGAFGQARQVAEDMLRQTPESPQAQALLGHVEREAASFALQQRRQLYGQVDRYCQSRQWRPALKAARQLLTGHASSPEAGEIAGLLDTIERNAHLEAARELRDQVRDLIERRRYREAVVVAQDLVARFSETQAAAELQGQIDRLQELATRNAH